MIQSNVNAGWVEECLKFSVPIRMFEMRNDPEVRLRWKAKEAAVRVGTQGDGMMMGGTKPSRGAGTFEALATMLAIGALKSSDGATYRGIHWCRDGRCTACVKVGQTDRGLFGGGTS